MPDNNVAVKDQKSNAVSTDVNSLDALLEFAGAGTEHVGLADVVLPRLTITQALSPQLNKKKPEYIEGCEAGMIIDVGTGAYFPEGVIILPVHFEKVFVEWAPRASGKGLVAVHKTMVENCVPDPKGRPITPEGNLVQETAQWYGLNLSAGRSKVFIPFSSTMLKRSRKWMTLAKGEKLKASNGVEFEAPLFYRSYHLTTAEESNAEGEWSTWVITRDKPLPEIAENWRQIMKEATDFRAALVAGELRGEIAQDETQSGEVAI